MKPFQHEALSSFTRSKYRRTTHARHVTQPYVGINRSDNQQIHYIENIYSNKSNDSCIGRVA